MADSQHPSSDPEPAREPDVADEDGSGGVGDPYAPSSDPYEGAVPQGYDWPTHGGYLGCLMGLIVACLSAGFLGSLVIGLVSVSPLNTLVGAPFARIMVLALSFVVCFSVLGRVGWLLGRRFYREYPQSGPSGASAANWQGAEGQPPQQHERVL